MYRFNDKSFNYPKYNMLHFCYTANILSRFLCIKYER